MRLGLVWAQTTGRMTRGHIKARQRQRAKKEGEEEDGESGLYTANNVSFFCPMGKCHK